MYGIGDQTSFQPYGDDELNQLQQLLGQDGGLAPLGAPEPPAQQQASNLLPTPEPQQPEPVQSAAAPPVVMGQQQAAAPPSPAPVQPYQPPPPPEPLQLPTAAPKAPGLPLAGVTQSGIPQQERGALMNAYGQLADQQASAAEAGRQAEQGIAERHGALADKGMAAAQQREQETRAKIAAEQATRAKLQQEGEHWSKMKEDPSKAFEGHEWAGVLAAIGIGAGTFAQAMGWQNGNPVLEQFDKAVSRSLAAQREQKQSRLAEIRERVGDSKASEQILAAQLYDAIQDRAQAEQQKAQTQDAYDRLGAMALAASAKKSELLLGAYERMVPQEQRTYQRPAATQGKDALTRLSELAELDKKLEERGAGADNPIRKQLREEMAGVTGQTGIEYQRDKDAKENAGKDGKFTESEGKAQAATESIGRLATAAGLVRDTLTGEWKEGEGGMLSKLGISPAVAEGVGSVLSLGNASTPVKDAFNAAVEAYGRYQSGGVIGDDERAEFRRLLGDGTTTRSQLASKLNAAETTLKARQPQTERGKGRTAPPNWK